MDIKTFSPSPHKAEATELVTEICCNCLLAKPLSQFSKHKGRSTGLQSRCKDCDHAYQAEYRKKHPRKKSIHAKSYSYPHEMEGAEPATEKICTKCLISKPRSQFSKHRGRSTGLQNQCKDCDRACHAESRKKHPRKAILNPPSDGSKVCPNCNVEKAYSAFRKDRYSSDGYTRRCIDCLSLLSSGIEVKKTALACIACGEEDQERFYYYKGRRMSRKCKRCQNLHRSRFGITQSEIKVMEEAQGKVCAICRNPETSLHQNGSPKRLSIDHCHDTGQIRGLLCTKCNAGLGQFNDDPRLLKRALEYLLSSASDVKIS